MTNSRPIVLAAGGTGGHLFPAQAVARVLIDRGRSVILITDERGLKWKDSFKGAEVETSVSATPFSGGLKGKISAALTISRGVFASFRRFGRLKPAVVVGFGGYPSIPPMLAAILRRIPRCIHEQNGVMGRANRALSAHMTSISVTVPDPVGLPPKAVNRQVVVGNPVRPEVIKKSRKRYPEIDADQPINLLVFGGSQGATVLSDVVPAAVSCLDPELAKRLNIHQQCREEDIERTRSVYEAQGVHSTVAPFFDDLPGLMSTSHLVISRSGASTVCELMVIGRPSILIPLPQALDGDQAANARFLVEAGGAWMFEQSVLTAEVLADLLTKLLKDPAALKAAAKIAKGMGRPNAAVELADLVESLDPEQGCSGDDGGKDQGGDGS